MGRWKIYKKDGTEREITWIEIDNTVSKVKASKSTHPDLKYSGEWMGKCQLTVTFTSAYPIDFEIGDYLMYRGEKFVINYNPSVIKQSRKGTNGEAFKYENVVFNSLSYELTDVEFLDYVLGDNSLHYTSLPEFPFFAASIEDFCDRLQANTNRYCEKNNLALLDYWLFLTPNRSRFITRASMLRKNGNMWEGIPAATAGAIWDEAYGAGTSTGDEKTDLSITISKQTVWDAMSMIKDKFGLNFINRGRRVVIGAAGISTSVFRYGKGNGLASIERVADTDQQIITKLYAYGSEKNLPVRYYANLNTRPYLNVTGDYHPGSTSDSISVSLEDLPSNSGAFTNKIHDNGSLRWYAFNIRIGNIECGANAETTGADGSSVKLLVFSEDAGTGVSFKVKRTTQANIDAIKALLDGGTRQVVFLSGVDVDKFPANRRISLTANLPNNMAVNRLMLPGFPNKSLYDWIVTPTSQGGGGGTSINREKGKATWTDSHGNEYTAYFSKDPYQPYIMSLNSDKLGIREASKTWDGSDGEEEIYPTIEGSGKDIISSAEMITDNGVFVEGDNEPEVTITLPNLGSDFNLDELIEEGTQDGGTPTIYMKDGYCGAREFEILSANKKSGYWECRCKREHDTLLDLWFPYSYAVSRGGSATANEPYQVRAGDKYVITGIPMTDTYVELNAVKLLEAALLFLSKNDFTRYTYTPEVDEIFMARDHQQNGENSQYMNIKEGDLLLFDDEDIDVDGSVYIESLNINEYGNGHIPTFKITLRNDKQVGTIQRIQNQLNSLSSFGTGGGSGEGVLGFSVQQIRQFIQAYGSDYFLSKLNDDVAQGVICFVKGIWVKAMELFGFDSDGNIKANNISTTGDINTNNIDSRGIITADHLVSHNYTGDGIADTGYRLTNDDGTGSSALTVDNLHVRKKATYEELEVKKETAIAGNQVYSCAANVITRTDYYDENGTILGYSKIRTPWLLKGLAIVLGKRAANFKLFGHYRTVRVYLPDASNINYVRCYFLAKDGDREVENMWQAGKRDGEIWQNHGNDLARCQTMNLKNSNRKTYISSVGEYKLGNVYWWRKAINVSSEPVAIDGQEYHYFDVAMNDCDAGSDIPAAGDHVVQFGNDSDPDRMNLIVLEVNGSDAPAEKFYEGIHNYNLNDCYYGGHTMKTRLSPKAGYKFQGSKFEIVTEYAVTPVPIERGEWVSGTTYYYYNLVQHDGATWLCVASAGNVYTVVEDIKNGNTVVYPEGTTLNQTQYDALTVSQKMLCTRTATGSTTLEPSEANSSVWRYYAQKGTSPYFADIDNEMDSVACDKDGKTTAAYSTTFRVYLWHGATEMTLSDITISGTTTDITATKNVTNKTVTVSVAEGKTIPLATELTITPKATGAPNDQSVHFVLNGVRPGADGKPAVLYSLIPSVSSIKCDKSNTLTPTSFTCSVQKVSGDSVSTATSTDGTLRYRIDNDITTSTQGTALTIGGTINNYTSSNKYIVLAFFEGTTLRDKERILIVADGVDGNGIVSITTTYARSSQASTASETTAPTINGSWSSTMPTLTDTYKYLWRKEVTTYTDTSKNTTKYFLAAVKGQEGENGKDGWMVTANPANVIITQSLGTDSTSFSTQAVTFSAKKGSVAATVSSLGTPAWTNFSGTKSGTTITVKSPTKDGSNNYYTEGKFVVTVNVTDPDTSTSVAFSITVPCYANLLGTWKENVEADTKTAIAQSTLYEFTGDSQVSRTDTLGQFIASSNKYETKLTSKVIDANGNVITSSGSVYQQTYDAIKLAVGNTGIDIVNNKITAKTSNFEIVNSSGTKTFGIDSSGNLESSGSASFKGKITATSGSIGGFSIGEHKINSSNNKIVLNDDGTATIGGLSITSTKTSFNGEITATSGSLGGFTIGETLLYNTNYNASISVKDKASSPTQVVVIGKDASDAYTGSSYKCSMQAEATGTGTYNTALYLNAQNGSYNYAFHGNGNGVLNGFMAGFRPQIITIPSGSSDTNSSRIFIREGSFVVIKGSHTSGAVFVGMPTLTEIRNTLGIGSSTPFFFELNVISYSTYEFINLAFRGASGQSGSEYPVLMGYDDRPWQDSMSTRTSWQIAQGDYFKITLTYIQNTSGTLDYRAYVLLNLN